MVAWSFVVRFLYLKRAEFFFIILFFLLGFFCIFYSGPAKAIIRGFGGDYVVVQAIYFFIRLFVGFNKRWYVVLGVFIISFGLEFNQLVSKLQVESLFDQYVLGSSFSYIDLLVYLLGIGTAYLLDYRFCGRLKVSNDLNEV